MKLDDLDRQLLVHIQEEFPLSERPFQALGEALGTDEDEVIRRIERLRVGGIIRRIGPILDLKRLGHNGVLVAMPVPADRIDEVADVVNRYQEISHNYLRPGPTEYNMWFTVSAHDERIVAILEEIEDETGLEQLNLPTMRIFKIGVRFEIPE